MPNPLLAEWNHREKRLKNISSSGKNGILSFALLSFGSSVGECWLFCVFMTSFSCILGIGEIAPVVTSLPIEEKVNALMVAWDGGESAMVKRWILS